MDFDLPPGFADILGLDSTTVKGERDGELITLCFATQESREKAAKRILETGRIRVRIKTKGEKDA